MHTEIAAPVRNKYRVPKKQWRKWSKEARAHFNYVYESMSDQMILKHPRTNYLPLDQWKTIKWNAAWLAADATMESCNA